MNIQSKWTKTGGQFLNKKKTTKKQQNLKQVFKSIFF